MSILDKIDTSLVENLTKRFLDITNNTTTTWINQVLEESRQLYNHVFFVNFQTFFVDFSCEITEKALKWTKKVEK